MAKKKRKKYPNLPNGFGSIKKLSGNRRNPYAVHPPTTEFTIDGIPITPKALCYVDDWYVGFAVLTAYKAGNYTPGLELTLKTANTGSGEGLKTLADYILSDYSRITHATTEKKDDGCQLTFAEIYEQYYNYKYNGKKEYSQSSKNSTKAAYRNCKSLHERVYASIDFEEMQALVDNCNLKHASLELIVSLLKQMGKYAKMKQYIQYNPAESIKINIEDDDEHGVPFSEAELKILWKNKEDDIVKVLLIMCYSGYRIGELNKIEVNISDKYFAGGIKTKASKERIVPIHSKILPIVKGITSIRQQIIPCGIGMYRIKLDSKLKELNIDPSHTPHDARHTFSTLCEKYNVRENDRKRMLGHSFTDITNKVYGHRNVDDLREEIEKIKVCY